MGALGDVGKFLFGNALDAVKGVGDESESAIAQRRQLEEQGKAAAGFARAGESNYGKTTAEAEQARQYLRDLAMGKNSVSAEQLRQGLQQNLAAQRSMAAGASPQNQAMAARTAAIQGGRLGAGLSGQQAIAGLMERQQAQKALNDAILGARGQDVQVGLGSRQNAIAGYGGYTPQKSLIEQFGPAAVGGLEAWAKAGSDERLKTDVKSGDDDAAKATKGLRAFVFKYRDEKYGKGKQVGVMAQDLEKAGLGHAVIDTPEGKMVHGAKAATSSLALVAALGRRVEKLEKGRK